MSWSSWFGKKDKGNHDEEAQKQRPPGSFNMHATPDYTEREYEEGVRRPNQKGPLDRPVMTTSDIELESPRLRVLKHQKVKTSEYNAAVREEIKKYSTDFDIYDDKNSRWITAGKHMHPDYYEDILENNAHESYPEPSGYHEDPPLGTAQEDWEEHVKVEDTQIEILEQMAAEAEEHEKMRLQEQAALEKELAEVDKQIKLQDYANNVKGLNGAKEGGTLENERQKMLAEGKGVKLVNPGSKYSTVGTNNTAGRPGVGGSKISIANRPSTHSGGNAIVPGRQGIADAFASYQTITEGGKKPLFGEKVTQSELPSEEQRKKGKENYEKQKEIDPYFAAGPFSFHKPHHKKPPPPPPPPPTAEDCTPPTSSSCINNNNPTETPEYTPLFTGDPFNDFDDVVGNSGDDNLHHFQIHPTTEDYQMMDQPKEEEEEETISNNIQPLQSKPNTQQQKQIPQQLMQKISTNKQYNTPMSLKPDPAIVKKKKGRHGQGIKDVGLNYQKYMTQATAMIQKRYQQNRTNPTNPYSHVLIRTPTN